MVDQTGKAQYHPQIDRHSTRVLTVAQRETIEKGRRTDEEHDEAGHRNRLVPFGGPTRVGPDRSDRASPLQVQPLARVDQGRVGDDVGVGLVQRHPPAREVQPPGDLPQRVPGDHNVRAAGGTARGP